MSGDIPLLGPKPEPIVNPSDRALARAMGVRLIRQFEGLRLTPYQDGAGVWTIGFGSTRLLDGSAVTATTPPLTEAEAVALCEHEMDITDTRVDASLKVYLPICWHAALYSFTYNEGIGAERSSTMLKLLNEGKTLAAADAMLDWDMIRDPDTGQLVQSPGLLKRRQLERAVALGLTTV